MDGVNIIGIGLLENGKTLYWKVGLEELKNKRKSCIYNSCRYLKAISLNEEKERKCSRIRANGIMWVSREELDYILDYISTL